MDPRAGSWFCPLLSAHHTAHKCKLFTLTVRQWQLFPLLISTSASHCSLVPASHMDPRAGSWFCPLLSAHHTAHNCKLFTLTVRQWQLFPLLISTSASHCSLVPASHMDPRAGSWFCPLMSARHTAHNCKLFTLTVRQWQLFPLLVSTSASHCSLVPASHMDPRAGSWFCPLVSAHHTAHKCKLFTLTVRQSQLFHFSSVLVPHTVH
ncbi:hypothetical protein NDU88_000202 [Pleurodeles waltl]|uniref:Uncharacterized protein n=1 Tax=Pleurodeles waltl TaxID=8319 RepID=A0AAV7V780_PLEWA|nr:hypothetical protein NDU88_000202 [Pleurodeles waltl]